MQSKSQPNKKSQTHRLVLNPLLFLRYQVLSWSSKCIFPNPVLRLSGSDFSRCLRDLENLRERNAETCHIFHNELTGALLKAHILDLYDIHARTNREIEINSRPARIMRRFIEMLLGGRYTEIRWRR